MPIKNKSKNKTVKKSKNTEKDNKIEYLEILIDYSLRSVDGKSTILDKLFLGQVKRLRFEVDKLVKGNQ